MTKRIPSARYDPRPLFPNWYDGTDLRSRPRFAPPLRKPSFAQVRKSRKASIEAMKRRHREWGLPC